MKKILIINSGSATLKFKIFSWPELKEEVSGMVERIGLADSFLEIKERSSRNFFRQNFPETIKNHGQALEQVLKVVKNYLPDIDLVGHRVVHGGAEFTEPTRLNSVVLEKLERYDIMAPLHNPINLLCARKALALLPQVEQFAVFDTAYYQTVPDYAYLYALPEKFFREYGIRRYGFHGLSHKYAAIEGAKKIKKSLVKLKIITCHLGGGASMTATKFGQAVDTTMGFTPLEGLTMATRAGDLDASVPLFMVEKIGLKPEEVDDILNKQSGLFGLCGLKDMRDIMLAAGEKVTGYVSDKKFSEAEKTKARLALKIFIYDIVRYLGQFTAIMKGVDLLVFTGGVGERSAAVRNLILKEVRSLGKFRSTVVEANEELMIAREIINKHV